MTQITINLSPEVLYRLQQELDDRPNENIDEIANRALRRYLAGGECFPMPIQLAIAIYHLLNEMHQHMPRHHTDIQNVFAWIDEWMTPDPEFQRPADYEQPDRTHP